jgi:DNA-binding transcriptional ArsR family regulator
MSGRSPFDVELHFDWTMEVTSDDLVQAKARRSDPVTSHMAAADASRHAPTNRQRALEALRRAGEQGLTDFELAAATGLAQTSVGVRRKELRDAGLVEAVTDSSGALVKRPAPSGSMAIVWKAVQ